MNSVVIIGRLVADPELRQTQSGIACCRLRIAVKRPYVKDSEQDSDFFNVVCWRNTAEFVSRYFIKGKQIAIEGRLQSNSYTDNNGAKHYTVEILANSVEFVGSKESGESTQPTYNVPETAATKQTDNAAGSLDIGEFEEILSDGENPF